MKKLRWTGAFTKDIKRLMKRRYDLARLYVILEMLRTERPLPTMTRPHMLKGKWLGAWECHIGFDWLLIYEITDKEIWLHRTSSHSDLFE